MADSAQTSPAAGTVISSTPSVAGRAVVDLADPRSLLRLNNLLQFLTGGAWYIGMPFMPLYLVSQGASAGVVGAVVGLSGIAPLAVSIHAGGLVDARGPTMVFVASVILFGVGGTILAALHGIPAAGIGYSLMAIANIGVAVASQAIVAAASTDATRIRNYGYYSLWYSAGAVAGPVVGGFLAGRFGYTSVFLVVALLMLPSVVVAAWLRGLPPPAHRAVSFGSAHVLVGRIVRERGVGPILFVSGMMVCAQALQTTFYPLYLSRVGLPATLIGLVIAAVSLASMVVRVLLASGVEWLGPTGALLGAMALIAVAFAVTPLVRTFWLLVGVSALMGASMGFTQPLSMSLLAETVAAEFWGVAFGIRQSVQRMGTIVSPFVFGAVSAARGVESAFYLGALALFGAAGIMTRVSGQIGRRPGA